MSQMIHEGLEYQRYTEPGREAKPELGVEAKEPVLGFCRRAVGTGDDWGFIADADAPVEIIEQETLERLRHVSVGNPLDDFEFDPRVVGKAGKLAALAAQQVKPVRPRIIRANGTIEEG